MFQSSHNGHSSEESRSRHRKLAARALGLTLRNAPDALAYRADIDGMRAVAVLAVVGFHAFPEYVPGGFIGVDVFFVISGFLISTIIFRQLSRKTFSLVDFYARRARRILPALCVVLATVLLFGFFALLPNEFFRLAKHAAAASAFAANIALWRESGYFAPSAQVEPLLHLWSLGIEEQFYLVWPLLVLWAWKRKWNIPLVVAGLSIASFILNLVLVEKSADGNFFFPLSRFWELGMGCLLAALRTFPVQQVAPLHDSTAYRSFSAQLPFIGVALIVFSMFSFNSSTPFPGYAVLIPVLGAVCLIAAPYESRFRQSILGSRAMVGIGVISYPLYLWHWPLLSFATILHSGTPNLAVRISAVILSFVLAFVTFRLIEQPVRRRRGLGVPLALGVSTAVLGIIALTIYLGSGFPQRFDTNVLAIDQGPKVDPVCLETVPLTDSLNYCRRTSRLSPQTVFLGDSQAQGVYEGVLSVLGPNYPMLLLGHGGCPPLLDVPATGPDIYASDAGRRICNDAWRAFADFIRLTKPPLVVLTGAGARFFAKPDAAVGTTLQDSEIDRLAFSVGLANLVRTLQQFSRVVYVLEIPTFESPPTCVLRPIRLPGDNCASLISRAALADDRSGYEASVRAVQLANPRLVVFDPIPSLCSATACSQQALSGELLYSDEMHLSPAGGVRLAQDTGLAKYLARSMDRADAEPLAKISRESRPESAGARAN